MRGEAGGFHFSGCFFLDGYDDHLMAEGAGAFQREQREAAIAGDETVFHASCGQGFSLRGTAVPLVGRVPDVGRRAKARRGLKPWLKPAPQETRVIPLLPRAGKIR